MTEKPSLKKQALSVEKQIIFTQEEMEYREDLQQKLLTLEHVKSILIGRDDSPVFLHQVNDLYKIVEQWYVNSVMAKRGEQNVPPAAKGDDSGEGTGTSDPDS